METLAVADKHAEQKEAGTPADAPKSGGRGFFRIVKAVAFVSIIVAVQVVVASMLTPRWQASLPSTNFVLPVINDVEIPDAFERFAARPGDPILVGASSAGERDAWVDEWEAALS